MAKKSTKGSMGRHGKASRARDLPADRKAKTVKGGAFQAGTLTTGNRYTISVPPTTFRNTI